MIQSASTPPPSPPMARIAILIGRTWSGAALTFISSRRERAALEAPLQRADHDRAHTRERAIEEGRVVDDRGAVERGAQHRRVRDLAAQPAADARVDHLGDRILAQRIGIGRDRERRAAGEADARVVAGAGVRVDADAIADHLLPPLAALVNQRGYG